jgi:uncharacterized protein YceK
VGIEQWLRNGHWQYQKTWNWQQKYVLITDIPFSF